MSNRIVVEVDLDNSDFAAGLRETGRQLSRFETEAAGAGRSLRGVEQHSGRAARGFGALVRSAAPVAGIAVAAAATARALQKVAVGGIKAAGAFERQNVAFGVLLGDLEAGNRLFGELQGFSARTPLAVEQLSTAAQMLMSFGVESERVIATLEVLGDAALGDAQKLTSLARAYGRVSARGRASMEEVNIAMEAGVPIIAALAAELGVAEAEVFQLVSAGRVSERAFTSAFQAMTQEGGAFEGGMDALAGTLDGKLSTAMDNVKLLGATLFEPAKEGAKGLLDTLTRVAQGMRASIEAVRRGAEMREGEATEITLAEYEQALSDLQALRNKEAELHSDQETLRRGRLESGRELSARERQEIANRIALYETWIENMRNHYAAELQIVKTYRAERDAQLASDMAAYWESQSAPAKREPAWWDRFEFGVLSSQSDVEQEIERQIDLVERQAAVARSLGESYDVAGAKAKVYRDAIQRLLEIDPTEHGGAWSDAFRVVDRSIANLTARYRAYHKTLSEPSLLNRMLTEEARNIQENRALLDALADAESQRFALATTGNAALLEIYDTTIARLREMRGIVEEQRFEWQELPRWIEAVGEQLELTVEQARVLLNTTQNLGRVGLGALTDGARELGAAYRDGAISSDEWRDVLAKQAQAILNQLPLLFVQAGLQLIVNGNIPLGLGFIFGGLASSFIAGYTDAQTKATRNADGNVFADGRVVPFAGGGVFRDSIVSSPVLFPMARGMGLMGEAGPEAVMPLGRDSRGRLGVHSIIAGGETAAPRITINNYTGQPAETSRRRLGDHWETVVQIGRAADAAADEGVMDGSQSRFGLRPVPVR